MSFCEHPCIYIKYKSGIFFFQNRIFFLGKEKGSDPPLLYT